MINYLDYAKNIHSQNGEDGIIAELIKRLNIQPGLFVEFGAWNGWYLSNTYALLESDPGWKGIYIEADEARYRELLETKNRLGDRITAIKKRVDYEGDNILDYILTEVGNVPTIFDVLSIDIDSWDWQVWYSIRSYAPKIVVIECNSLVLPGIWQTHKPGTFDGASFSALVALGKSKGYIPVAHTGNLIFVLETIANEASLEMNPMWVKFPEMLFNYDKYLSEKGNR